jgi:hypothetical protein
MRKGILGTLAVLSVGAGLTFGQPKSPPPPSGGPPMLAPPGMGPGGPVGPDGQPYIAPPGFDGMGMGPPGGPMYGDPGMGQEAPYGSGGGILGGLFGPRNGPPAYWANGDFLFWQPSAFVTRYPIVTTSAPLDFGRVGGLTTAALGPGDRNIAFDSANGFRVFAGFALDQSGEVGVEAGGFWVNTATRDFTLSSNNLGVPLLAIPFQDINTGTQAAYVVAFPGINYGSVNVSAQSRIFEAEGNLVYNLYQSGGGPGGLTLLAGPRFMQIKEELDVSTTSTTTGVPPIVPPPPAGGILGASFFPAAGGTFAGTVTPFAPPYLVTTADRIKTTNDFYGGQVGFRGDIGFGSYFMSLTGKIGAGYMRETVELQGGSTFAANGAATSLQPGGIYNLAQELGKSRRDQFAVMGEGGVNFGYQVFSFLRFQGGYTFMWVNHVVRPTRELSPVLNPNLMPVSPTYTGASPATIYPRGITNETDYHIQGFNLGLQIGF